MKKGPNVRNFIFASLFRVLLTFSCEHSVVAVTIRFVQVYALIGMNFGLIKMKNTVSSFFLLYHFDYHLCMVCHVVLTHY